jgi:hypothetical protein
MKEKIRENEKALMKQRRRLLQYTLSLEVLK